MSKAKSDWWMTTIDYPAPTPGVYRFTLGRLNGATQTIASLGWKPWLDRHGATSATDYSLELFHPFGSPSQPADPELIYRTHGFTFTKSIA